MRGVIGRGYRYRYRIVQRLAGLRDRHAAQLIVQDDWERGRSESNRGGSDEGCAKDTNHARERYFNGARARGTVGSVTSDHQVLIGKPIAGCPLLFLKFSIHKYQIMYERRYATILADMSSLLRQDVCECLLESGDTRACTVKKILAEARPLSTQIPDGAQLDDIEVFITDAEEFKNLFEYISANVPPRVPPPPIRPPWWKPPSPVPVSIPAVVSENECERSAKLCMSPKDGKVSAEFSVKCKNTPEFTFSTDGEASMKLGRVSVSFSTD